jgi:hypothetical protein
MPMIMYFCVEMAKRGDEDFFRALIKSDIMADVLQARNEHYEVIAATARKHGHENLAAMIAVPFRYIKTPTFLFVTSII